jgi:hypothetical protein
VRVARNLLHIQTTVMKPQTGFEAAVKLMALPRFASRQSSHLMPASSFDFAVGLVGVLGDDDDGGEKG